ncbi:MAG: hypothetical protein LBD50_00255 [Rickettsiales bacterium]|jgi:hypothetical protein|nr:hypothetical protein [Rickettsiales bacterium]
MNKKIDNFLLGLLWLLATALGASFWFNTKYGFNIFFLAHWEYLGQLQASRIAIEPFFYISMILSAFIMIGGLYVIIRPRFRKIKIPEYSAPVAASQPAPGNHISAQIQRPPRLNLPKITVTPQVSGNPARAPLGASGTESDSVSSETFKEIEEIFESAGFLIKKPPKFGNMKAALFAIGADEVLWIGGVGMEPSKMADMVQKFESLFKETLDELSITINVFILNPASGDDVDSSSGIEKFDSIENLREYVDEHKNRTLAENEEEDFKAYSEYMDTVLDYFSKL